MSSASTPSSTVLFPASEPTPAKNVHPVPQIHGPYLPFRRISLPTTPSKLHRESMISVASFKSMPEDREAETQPAFVRNVQPSRNEKGHMSPTYSPRRGRRRHVPMKPVNDAKLLKRGKVIQEFYETERTYVEGLDLIHSHFLTPIIESLDESEPLLDRAFLTSVFSNFIDILNLHRSFFSSLSTFLTSFGIPSASSMDNPELPPPLSPLLLAHFPYLSLYNPFVTAFPTAMSNLTDLVTPPSPTHPNPKYSAAFTTFLASQESDPRCGKLKLRDWLLTIVQRCPRYLLLLKDLIACTDEDDPEYVHLKKVQVLASKVTLSLNNSLHTHAQTLALLSLQRATPNLPFQLILPGRTFLRRGPLLQIERSGLPCEREFLLFSDCLIWLAGEAAERVHWKGDWRMSRSGWGFRSTEPDSIMDRPSSAPETSSSSQSKSEDEVSSDKAKVDRLNTNQQEQFPTTPARQSGRNKLRKSCHPHPNMIIRRKASRGGDERWTFKGRAELIDLEVVVTPARDEGEERRFEILSPEGSFVLYTGTGEDRDAWCNEIREAKAQLLSSLNVTHPNSTLTSSSSTSHLRRSLQALPFSPSGKRAETDRPNGKSKEKIDAEPFERRRKVEHWVPAIWIPDDKTNECMRCGNSFSWRTRRHHCRLCGRCVCASCSGRTFFISDPHAKDDLGAPARACNACYETVFPLVDPVPGAPLDATTTTHKSDTNPFPSLSSLPTWLSMPSLQVVTTPQALMAIDPEPFSPRSDPQNLPNYDQSEFHDRVRARPVKNARVRSYDPLLADFEQNEHGPLDSPLKAESDRWENELKNQNDEGGSKLNRQSTQKICLSSLPRKDDTARKKKRFSLPAVALHMTNVTTRTSASFDDDDFMQDGSRSPITASKRFSLVLGGGRHHKNSGMRNESEATMSPGGTDSAGGGRHGMGISIAAGKLVEILARKRGFGTD